MTTPRPRRPSVARQQTSARQPTPLPPLAPETRTRLIRFRLNPRSSSDRQILSWLEQHAPYYRADAIRTALLTHILRRSVASDPPAGGSLPVLPAAPLPATGTSSGAVQKLEKLFPS